MNFEVGQRFTATGSDRVPDIASTAGQKSYHQWIGQDSTQFNLKTASMSEPTSTAPGVPKQSFIRSLRPYLI